MTTAATDKQIAYIESLKAEKLQKLITRYHYRTANSPREGFDRMSPRDVAEAAVALRLPEPADSRMASRQIAALKSSLMLAVRENEPIGVTAADVQRVATELYPRLGQGFSRIDEALDEMLRQAAPASERVPSFATIEQFAAILS